MHYRTIVLELIQERPALYEALRGSKRLLTAMDAYATELKELHQAWADQLDLVRPNSDPSQIAAEALELAIDGLRRDHLPRESTTEETELLSLEAAMDCVSRHSPPV